MRRSCFHTGAPVRGVCRERAASTIDPVTHYDVLGVPPTASTAEIRKAYVRLARRHHPDFYATADATSRAASEREMRRINEAWAVLSDPDRRRDYDRSSQPSPRPGAAGVAPPSRPKPTGGPSPGFRPYDTSDEIDPIDLLDDTPINGASSVPRWIQIAPVALLAVSLGSLAVALVTSIRPLLAFGVLTFALSAVAFLVAPMLAVLRSAQSDRD